MSFVHHQSKPRTTSFPPRAKVIAENKKNQQFQLGLCIIGYRPTGQLGNGASNVPLGNVATVVMQTRSDMRQALIQRMVKFTVRLDSMLRALPPSGRGRRPRRPASPLASPWTSPLARRAGDVAPDHVVRAKVWRGRGRRPRRPASASPWTSSWARRAGDVAPYHGVRAGVWRGRGRRPRRLAFSLASPWARRAGDVASARRMPFPARRGKWALPFARLNGQVFPSPPPTYFFNRRDSASPANEGAHLLPRPRFWYNDAD